MITATSKRNYKWAILMSIALMGLSSVSQGAQKYKSKRSVSSACLPGSATFACTSATGSSPSIEYQDVWVEACDNSKKPKSTYTAKVDGKVAKVLFEDSTSGAVVKSIVLKSGKSLTVLSHDSSTDVEDEGGYSRKGTFFVQENGVGTPVKSGVLECNGN